MLVAQAEQMIHASMIVMGIATILQTLRHGRIGSGYLCLEQVGPAYISVSILPVKAGGLPLLAGMTLVSGLFGVWLPRLMGRRRPLFSAEVTGTIVMMVGLALIPVAVSRFLGIEESGGVFDAFSVSIDSYTFFLIFYLTF